jgi:hypothetical protein
MCEKCSELDRRIEHYKWLTTWVDDQVALEGIRFLIVKYCADKESMHSDR